jgi:hypothetical protein
MLATHANQLSVAIYDTQSVEWCIDELAKILKEVYRLSLNGEDKLYYYSVFPHAHAQDYVLKLLQALGFSARDSERKHTILIFWRDGDVSKPSEGTKDEESAGG